MNRIYLRRPILLALVIAPAAIAQIHPHFGVEAGVPLTDTLVSSSFISVKPAGGSFDRYNSKTKRLLIGPMLRVDFVRGLGLEFDALYQRVNFDFTTLNSAPGSFNQTFQQTTANKWEFPLLVQYDFPVWKARPFVEAGPSILHITGTKNNIGTTSSMPPSSTVSTSSGQTETWAGFTMGGGLDVRRSRLHLRPEFRYSRWFSPTAGPIGGGFFPFSGSFSFTRSPEGIHLNQNEASFLLGLTF
jgi:hypothetical protein